uniref:Uncharacterized protein n=1 Tax=viral metagenome TaxID=1070528 RepID=A0A6C0IXR7_9ZZZZ
MEFKIKSTKNANWNSLRGSKIDRDKIDLEHIEKNILNLVYKEFKDIKFKEVDNKYGKINYK